MFTGLQGRAFFNDVRVSLPLNETLLPQVSTQFVFNFYKLSKGTSGIKYFKYYVLQYLKKQGYSTALVGKWHLGYYKNTTTPNKRGYDSFFGYYGGWVRYNDSKNTMVKLLVFLHKVLYYTRTRNAWEVKYLFLSMFCPLISFLFLLGESS